MGHLVLSMNIRSGIFLKSTLQLRNDEHFASSIIYITEYNQNGAMGFIVNKIFSRSFNELVEFSNSPSLPLWNGGPVANDKLFFIHRRADILKQSIHVSGDIYFGGNFTEAVKLINQSIITENYIKLFIGYCGWDKGELEAEIEEGSWELFSKFKLFG